MGEENNGKQNEVTDISMEELEEVIQSVEKTKTMVIGTTEIRHSIEINGEILSNLGTVVKDKYQLKNQVIVIVIPYWVIEIDWACD